MKKNLSLCVLIFAFALLAFGQGTGDAALRRVTAQDAAVRAADRKLPLLTVDEHLYRADVYMANRHFAEAREHWQKILDHYPTNTAAMPRALFGFGRSFMWEREYQKSVDWFDKLTKDYLSTKEGREGLSFKGASYVRLGKNAEAAKTYEQYTVMFPNGERIESAHLNIIDALREAKRYDEANAWVNKTRARFAGKPTETNALHGRLRMEIHRGNWAEAIRTADEMMAANRFAGSMSTIDEIRYLKGMSLEKLNRTADAVAVYFSIGNAISSYWGGLAEERLAKINQNDSQIRKTSSVTAKYYADYPVLFRAELLRAAKTRDIDPRFVLAIMKQESSFRANAKSPAAARGLLQLVFDTALKYNKKAGYPTLAPDDLYQPSVNIAIGTAYIAALKDEFGGLYEAIAASYNGGEDNAARWLGRTKPRDSGVFTAEVGFAETKNYVYKVMGNYRVYRELYTEDLVRK